jgi:hypothetical protein
VKLLAAWRVPTPPCSRRPAGETYLKELVIGTAQRNPAIKTDAKKPRMTPMNCEIKH